MVRRHRGTTGCKKCDNYRNLSKPPNKYECDCHYFIERLKAGCSSYSPITKIDYLNGEMETRISMPKIVSKTVSDGLLAYKNNAIKAVIYSHVVRDGQLCDQINCSELAQYVCNSCDISHRACAIHTRIKGLSCCMLDNYGMPPSHSVPESKRERILLISSAGWEYIDQISADELLNGGFFPATPEFPELAFSIKMLCSAVNQIGANGLSYQGTLNGLICTHRIPPPVDIESRFRQVIQLFMPWYILLVTGNVDSLEFREKDNDHMGDRLVTSNPFRCPVCFADPDTKQTIFLVINFLKF